MKKIALVYYSGTGNTEAMAKAIEDAITDLERIPLTSPETNDNSNYLLWITCLFISVSVMSAIVYSKKKHGIK